MTTQAASVRLPPLPAVAWRFLARLALLAMIWLGFNGADGRSWMVGGPVVLAAAWLSVRLLPAMSWRCSVGGAIRFVAYFLRESWRGGWGVARHAFASPLRMAPGFIRHEFRLGPGPARWFFCNAISLLPGTAVVAIEGETVVVHVLDACPQAAEELRELEHRVAALFGLPGTQRGGGCPLGDPWSGTRAGEGAP